MTVFSLLFHSTVEHARTPHYHRLRALVTEPLFILHILSTVSISTFVKGKRGRPASQTRALGFPETGGYINFLWVMAKECEGEGKRVLQVRTE